MGEVLNLPERKAPEAETTHLSGQAFCAACHHKWVAAAPVGAVHLECPKCSRMWGLFKQPVEPEVTWVCNCGESLFFLTPHGAQCRKCGNMPVDWV